ncbi:GAF domain-containing sensor histidine kinase [Symbiobacterium terraclitae]|uniref:GAF domain-containing sensor histidine kinase n=1 Tax=Symbiobacterium terraclitae TaxID=557451 RepID=UPI0035B4FAA7
MEMRRMRPAVTAISAGAVLIVEVLRRSGHLQESWIWTTVLVAGVVLFTHLVFNRLEALGRTLDLQQQRMERLFSSTAVGIVLVGQGCRILRANPAACRLTEYAAADLEGKKVCSDLFTRDSAGQPICFSQCLGMLARGDTSQMRNMSLRARSGREVAVAVSVTALSADEFYLLFWDVSERTRLERELARRRRQVESLYQVGRELAAVGDLDRNLERLLEKARGVMEADVAGWGTLHEGTLELTWQVVVGPDAAGALPPLPLAGSVVGRLLVAGRPYVTQDIRADVAANGEAAAAVGRLGLKAALAVPMRVHDRQYGVLFVGHRRRVRMNDEDLMLLSNLASHLSIAVENVDLLARMRHLAALEERQRLAREMHDSFGQTLTLFGVRLHLMEGMARAGQTEELLSEIVDLRAVLKESHQDVRRSIFQLKESGPPLAPLWERWAEHLRLFQEQTGIRVEMTGRDAVPAHLPDRVESQLTRVVQEALNNVRNHSGARTVSFNAWRDGHSLVLAIRDDGCGFELEKTPGPAQFHFGLGIMRERMESVQGRLEITSELGRGTTVKFAVPVAEGGSNHVADQGAVGR